jgi:hypothetical protein
VVVVAVTALLTYGGIRALRPDFTPGDPWLAGTLGDLGRVFLHFDLGHGCFQPLFELHQSRKAPG